MFVFTYFKGDFFKSLEKNNKNSLMCWKFCFFNLLIKPIKQMFMPIRLLLEEILSRLLENVNLLKKNLFEHCKIIKTV